MLPALHPFLSMQSPRRIGVLSFFLVLGIGLLDLLTGYEFAFSIFYLIPVAISAWYGGRRLGGFTCLLSAAIWALVDNISGHSYIHPAVAYWNAGVRFGFFVIVTQLLLRLRSALSLQTTLAQHDGLTGLLNARTFRQRYDLLANTGHRPGQPISLGYLDLDGFKAVNDQLGHEVGDRVLQAVAAELANRLRATDLAGRIGGDEFALLLPDTGVDGARSFFTSLRERLLELAARNGWPISFSIGVAVFQTLPGQSEDAIRYADQLMYRVKRSGKNAILCEQYRDQVT